MGFSEERRKKGVAGEAAVQQVIETLWDVRSTSADPTNAWDYLSETDAVEQKTRFNMNSSKYDEWLFPVNKINNCRNEVRRCHLIYYFPDDNTLWYLDYDPILFATYKTKYIWAEHCESYLIPAGDWKRISWGPPEGVHLEVTKN